MDIKKLLAVCCISIVFTPQNIFASIISIDYKSSGDNLITRDTTSGLEWLDLTVTNNQSRNTTNSMLSKGSELHGWRFATTNEVNALWLNFDINLGSGLSEFPSYNDTNIATAATYLGNILGEYNSSEFPYGVMGFTAEERIPLLFETMGAFYSLTDGTSYYGYQSIALINDTSWVHTGSYLVRNSPVPIPASIWLFTSGFISLAGLAKHREKYNT